MYGLSLLKLLLLIESFMQFVKFITIYYSNFILLLFTIVILWKSVLTAVVISLGL